MPLPQIATAKRSMLEDEYPRKMHMPLSVQIVPSGQSVPGLQGVGGNEEAWLYPCPTHRMHGDVAVFSQFKPCPWQKLTPALLFILQALAGQAPVEKEDDEREDVLEDLLVDVEEVDDVLEDLLVDVEDCDEVLEDLLVDVEELLEEELLDEEREEEEPSAQRKQGCVLVFTQIFPSASQMVVANPPSAVQVDAKQAAVLLDELPPTHRKHGLVVDAVHVRPSSSQNSSPKPPFLVQASNGQTGGREERDDEEREETEERDDEEGTGGVMHLYVRYEMESIAKESSS